MFCRLRPLDGAGRLAVVRAGLALVTLGIVVPTFVVPERSALAARELAAPAAPAANGKTQRAFLDLKVNGVANGQILVILRQGDMLVALADLQNAGLHDIAGRQEETAGGAFVSLASLAPAVTYAYDEATLGLALTVDPSHLERSVVDLDGISRTITVTRSKRSAYLDYAATVGSNDTLSVSGQANVALGPAVVSSTFLRGTNGTFAPGQTNVTFDNVAAARRVVAGVTSLQGGGRFGGSAQVNGVSIERNFTLDPNLIRTQDNDLSGVVATPSTAEVYVNGILVRSQPIDPGTFTLSNLPLAGGSNVTYVVLKDAFGRTSTIDKPFYVAPALMKKGLVSYDAGVGRSRASYDGTASGIEALANVSAGISRTLTASARTECSASVRSFGAAAATANRFGEFTAEFGASRAIAGALPSTPGLRLLAENDPAAFSAPPPNIARGALLGGRALQVGYTYQTRRSSVVFSLLKQSPFYANLGQSPLADRTVLERRLAVTIPAGARAITLSDDDGEYRDRQRVHEVVLSTGLALRRLGTLTVGLGRAVLGGRSSPVLRVNFDAQTHGGSEVSVFSQADQGERSRGVQLSRRAVEATGIGYTVSQTSSNGSELRNGALSFDTSIADVNVSATQSGRTLGASATIAGGVAAVGRSVVFTQPINGGFALVDLDGVRGVRASVNNRVYGRTDRSGKILVPDLFSYQRNEIAIAGADAPEDVLIDTDKKVIAPAYRSGVVVTFPAKRIRSYTGKLRIAASPQPIVPAYGEITLGDPATGFGSDIGTDGGFYFENARPGSYPARIAFKGGTCDFTVTIPKSDVAVTRLGTLVCDGPLRPASGQ